MILFSCFPLLCEAILAEEHPDSTVRWAGIAFVAVTVMDLRSSFVCGGTACPSSWMRSLSKCFFQLPQNLWTTSNPQVQYCQVPQNIGM